MGGNAQGSWWRKRVVGLIKIVKRDAAMSIEIFEQKILDYIEDSEDEEEEDEEE